MKTAATANEAASGRTDPYGCFSSALRSANRGRHISAGPSINPRDRATSVFDLVCPPTSVVTLGERHDLSRRRYLRWNSYVISCWKYTAPDVHCRVSRYLRWTATVHDSMQRGSLPPAEIRCLGFQVNHESFDYSRRDHLDRRRLELRVVEKFRLEFHIPIASRVVVYTCLPSKERLNAGTRARVSVQRWRGFVIYGP